MDTFAILNHVCVKPDYRKHRIATHMLDAVEKICEQRNCVAIKLWSRQYILRLKLHKQFYLWKDFYEIHLIFLALNSDGNF